MKTEKLSLYVFIDALGWDILQAVDFFDHELQHRRRLKSVLGYSSTAIPSILTGRLPNEHGHFSFYYYDPEGSPFRWLRPLSLVPKFLSSRARLRNRISRALKRIYGYTGYFQIYNMPFRYIHLFNYCEKKDIFAPDGIINGDSIFLALEMSGVPCHVSDWRAGEEANFESVMAEVENGAVEWAFFYNANLDGIMHIHGVGSEQALRHIDTYRRRLARLFEGIAENYRDVDIYLFSDHGMANVEHHHGLRRDIDRLGFTFGRDYVAVYDSTMARFWFMNQDSRAAIVSLLDEMDYGEILDRRTMERYGVHFPDAKYGELFFLLKEGHLIVPSFMGERPIVAMHGYHPEAPSSYAALISNREIPEDIRSITDLYKLMVEPIKTRLSMVRGT